MKSRLLLSAAALLLISALGYGQDRTCHTMGNLDRLLHSHPELEQNMERIEQFTEDYVSNPQLRANTVVTIPVVFNVVYKTSAQNVSDAQLLTQLQVLNDDFRRLNSDADNTWSQAADSHIEFCLATVDPDGNATTGIRRKQTSKPSFSANDAVKTASQGLAPWDASSYLNVWVCNLNGFLGYAQFPGGPAATDGVVIDYQYIGTIGTATAPFDLGRTTTHEVGHWLNLRHIWGDGGCSVDDFVSDTPLSDGPNYGCALGHVSCGTTDMVQNYMDYSDDDCMNLFTSGQSDRMNAQLAPGGFRFSISQSAACGTPPDPTCDDGIQNGDETGVDCGGASCPACPEPTCDDGIQNGDETGVDCGGSSCPDCPTVTCDVPTGTFASNIKRNRAKLNWDAMSGAVSYTVQLRQQGDTNWPSEATTTESTINATGLTNGVTYEWHVRTNCSGESSAYSPVCSFTAGNGSSSSCAGARFELADHLNVYPNPTTSLINVDIDWNADVMMDVQLLDSTGRLIESKQAFGLSHSEFLTGETGAGIYFIRVVAGDQHEIIKVMVN